MANAYRTLSLGHVVGNHDGMGRYLSNKAKVVGQIQRLSYAALSQAFDGLVGKAQLEGIRQAMVEDLIQHNGPVYTWREVAARVKGASCHSLL